MRIIGHSSHTLTDFHSLLDEYRIEATADVRRFFGSLRHPHVASEAVAESLPEHGIAYRWFPPLGGRRKVQPSSPNADWRNASLQGCADRTGTQEFVKGLAEMLQIAATKRTAMMCAEVLWWRCHRSFFPDVLKLRGVEVTHIMDTSQTTEHPYTSADHFKNARLS